MAPIAESPSSVPDYVPSYYASTRSAGEPRAPLDGSYQTEVCVIGGGLAGLSTALELAERGRYRRCG